MADVIVLDARRAERERRRAFDAALTAALERESEDERVQYAFSISPPRLLRLVR